MRRTILVTSCLISCLATACQRAPQAPATAQATAATTQAVASTRVGGVTLQTSTVATADINAQIAQRYGIDAASEGLVLLVTVRDDAGNAVDPGNLQLSATASVLPDPPAPLALRKIDAERLTDYIGVLPARAPASAQFRITATKDGARADIATTAELFPR